MEQRRLIVVSDQGTALVFADMFHSVTESTKSIEAGDVVLFEGGTDVNPKYYSEQRGARTQFPDFARDAREAEIFKQAQAVGAACLGICRGAQLLTILSGGKVIQDVTGHGQYHNINTDKGDFIYVSSTHHQMCYPFDMPKDNYRLIAWSSLRLSKHYLDGENKEPVEPPVEPEIVWYPKTRSLAIQGHPEYMASDHPFALYSRALVRKFIGV